ncbi:MAG: hypothetical protein AAF936_09935 [Pseudomonadota bacterium]
MTWLSTLLIVKIAVTTALIAAPFLLAPRPVLAKRMGVETNTSAMFRLYGVAMAALLVGYGFGIVAAQAGVFPWGVVAVGLVSNGGAFIALLVTGAARKSTALTAFLVLITVGLVAAMLAPDAALTRAF